MDDNTQQVMFGHNSAPFPSMLVIFRPEKMAHQAYAGGPFSI
jgi:hypothetical protein